MTTSPSSPGLAERPRLRESDYWRTPLELLARVREVSPIVLDPCGTADNWTGALHAYTEAGPVASGPDGDGLAINWRQIAGFGLVFVNPPYSPGNLPLWVRKMAHEAARGAHILALLPANTDTRWFQDRLLKSTRELCFLRGRMRFISPWTHEPDKGGGRFASVLAYWPGDAGEITGGPKVRATRFRGVFGGSGWNPNA